MYLLTYLVGCRTEARRIRKYIILSKISRLKEISLGQIKG